MCCKWEQNSSKFGILVKLVYKSLTIILTRKFQIHLNSVSTPTYIVKYSMMLIENKTFEKTNPDEVQILKVNNPYFMVIPRP